MNPWNKCGTLCNQDSNNTWYPPHRVGCIKVSQEGSSPLSIYFCSNFLLLTWFCFLFAYMFSFCGHSFKNRFKPFLRCKHYGLNCIPPKFLYWNLNPQRDGIWRQSLWVVIRVTGVREGGAHMYQGLHTKRKREGETVLSALWGYSEVALCKPGRGFTRNKIHQHLYLGHPSFQNEGK